MVNDKSTEQQPVENVVIAFAANIHLRQSRLELEELLFLYDRIKEAISKYQRELH